MAEQDASAQRPAFTERPTDDGSLIDEALMQRRISDLGLKIEGTRLEPLVKQLYAELEQAGIDLKPPVYLADEWGCPEGMPIIGIPFYLADERLTRLEDRFMEGVEAESDADIMRYLRHEAGHAFNYAYRLHETEEWHSIFGPYSRPYREDYRPNPFSRDFVRHISGWYAQKHPDEDFAESFAVWLTPGFDWRSAYAGWGALRKLDYVDRIVRERGRTPPRVTAEGYDPAGELDYSIAEHYERFGYKPQKVPAYFDGDLKDLFEAASDEPDGAEPAAAFLRRHRRTLVNNIAYWTGLHEGTVRSLIDHFIERCQALGLRTRGADEAALLTELTAYATTLCMNRLYKGDFIIK
jgi:hypothetical protein